MRTSTYQVRKIFDLECVHHNFEKYWTVFENGKPIADFPMLENFNSVRQEILRRREFISR